MKLSAALLLFAGLLLGLAGCGHLDATREGSPDRELKGAIAAKSPLPAGAQVFVRLVDAAPRESARTAQNDLPIVDRAKPLVTERIVAEWSQTLSAATSEPVPFRLSYTATDAELRHGLNLEARISYGGKLRHRTINARVVTLASSPFQHTIDVEPVQ